MKRILLVVAYDGTNYHGWQLQPNGVTIEEVLNNSLKELLNENVKVSGASRTDTGVHALCNLAVFDTNTRIPGEKISYALNQRLPYDVRIQASVEVDEHFHPRYISTEKTYEYRIWNSEFMNPVKRLYTHFTYYKLDVEAMKKGAGYLVGEHDFKSFCSVGSQAETTVRNITGIEVYKEGKEIIIRVSGLGFLYNMVRIIAGTLLEIGRGVMRPEEVLAALKACDRDAAGPTAPASGLTLVKYEFLDDKYRYLNEYIPK